MTKSRKRPAEKRSFAPRQGETKHDMLVRMMQSPTGVTSAEMEKATGWKPHSVRGLVGALKKRSVPVTSVKEKGQPVRYHIPAGSDSVGDVV